MGLLMCLDGRNAKWVNKMSSTCFTGGTGPGTCFGSAGMPDGRSYRGTGACPARGAALHCTAYNGGLQRQGMPR